MSIKVDETTRSFMYRLVEQAEKLADMGEEVSKFRKMTRVKEGLVTKYIHLAQTPMDSANPGLCGNPPLGRH
jgi:hypothetical protein